MYTSEALVDIHRRTHSSLEKLLDHCAGFSAEALDRELEGFGYPTLRAQLQHMIGAEQYWIGVLRGEMLVEERDEDAKSLAALRAFRARVAAQTVEVLSQLSDAACGTPRRLRTWGGKEVDLAPAHVLLRTQMHTFQHQGQVAAMARLLGRPVPAGLDFPLR